MIPRIIHYCWFGSPPSFDVRACIASWKKKMPDYQFKCWNEDNFDIHSSQFVEEAFSVGKYAFVSDYIRCYALYHEGGIYLDTDVVALKRFDSFLNNGFFTAMERFGDPNNPFYDSLLDENRRNRDHSLFIPYLSLLSAIIGSEPGHPFIKKMLDLYSERTFFVGGEYNDKIIITMLLANVAEEFGYRYVDEDQRLANGVRIYPEKFLCCKMRNVSAEAYAVHCGFGSWLHSISWLKHFLNWMKIKLLLIGYGV